MTRVLRQTQAMDEMTCPRCGGDAFNEVECGPDGWDDDITYTSDVCKTCALWYDGWAGRWYVDVTAWTQIESADEYVPLEHH